MKILGISDGCHIYTGFGTQTFNVLKGLQNKGHEVEQIGWFTQEHIVHMGIKITPAGEYGSLEQVVEKCNEFKPDIIWSLGDLHMVEHMLDAPENIKKRWVHWLPIDAEPYPHVLHKALEKVTHLVLMADFAYDMCKPHLNNLYKIPHGLDPNVFKPLENKNSVRKKNGVNDKFVVLMVAKNQWRKNIDLAVESFAHFSKGKDDVVFIMHTQPMSVPKLQGIIIPHVINMYKEEIDNKLNEKVKISAKQLDEKYLNIQYNLSDCFLLTSAGEGFGIPTQESLFTETPVVISDCTTGKEFVLPDGKETNRTGELIKIAVNKIQWDASIKRAMIDPIDAGLKLDKMYESWKTTDKRIITNYGKNGRRIGMQKYTLSNVVNQWNDLVKTIFNNIDNEPYKPTTVTQTSEFSVDDTIYLEEL